MAVNKLESVITSFTPEGDFLAISSPNGIKIWNTNTGSLLAEWKPSDNLSDTKFTCMACSHIGKKRKKGHASLLLAMGTDAGETLAMDGLSGESKWKYTGSLSGGISGLSFANRGRSIYIIRTNGMASEVKSETGELVREFEVSKAPISSSACSSDERILATAGGKTRVINLENAKELLKFSADSGPVHCITVSDQAKAVITSGPGKKGLQVWKCDLSTRTVSEGPVLSMKHAPVLLDCKESCNDDDGLVILSVSEKSVAYVWKLNNISDEQLNPTKVSVKSSNVSAELQGNKSAKKSLTSIIAARLQASEAGGQVTALITYGSIDSPQFSLVDINNPGEDIVVTARDANTKTNAAAVEENGIVSENGLGEELEAVAVPVQNKKANKKRAATDLDLEDSEKLVDHGHEVPMGAVEINDDLNEPTMGEKLASLNLQENDEGKIIEKQESSPRTKPPRGDSVHVLLKQALHADDRTLLLRCLYIQEEKVIANSVSALSPSYVLKLLDSLVSIVQSRGAVVVCAVPWLRSLLLQHASGIISQESSLHILNSLYQVIESRVSTCHKAFKLSSSLDLHCAGNFDDDAAEDSAITPIIFEDKDTSDEEVSEDAMETDQDDNEHETLAEVSDIEEGSDMSD